MISQENIINNALQVELFKNIKHQSNDDAAFVEQVAQTLSLSKSGAYKKINGASRVHLEELRKLCNSFNFSTDQFLKTDNTSNSGYSFYSDALKFAPKNFSEYWENMLAHLELIRHLPGLNATFLSNEIPFSHYMQFPNLLYFKMYVWNRTSWQLPMEDANYNKSIFQSEPSLKNTTQEIISFFNSFPTTEIWNPQMLSITFMQLSYYIRAGVFTDVEDIRDIINDIDKMLCYMKEIAEDGAKKYFGKSEKKAPIQIYLNELTLNSELIFINSIPYRMIYNKYDPPNYVRSDDKQICDHAEAWMEDVINQSTLISQKGQRDRNFLFKTLFDNLDRFVVQTEGMIKTYF